MDYYETLLANLPDPASVWADAADRFPGHPTLADRWAAVAFEGLYQRARGALDALVGRIRREDRLAADPPEEPDVPDTRDAEPVGAFLDGANSN